MWLKYSIYVLLAVLWAAAVPAAEGDTQPTEEPSVNAEEGALETPAGTAAPSAPTEGEPILEDPGTPESRNPEPAPPPRRWKQRPLAAQLREALQQARAETQTVSTGITRIEEEGRSLFRDTTAVGVGDILTVLITETAVASSDSQQNSSKQYGADLQAGTGLFSFLPAATLGYNGSASTKGSVSKRHNILATVTVTIMEQLPNGNFRIEGSQEILIDGRKQLIRLTGIVRPLDIGSNNTVLSSALADAKIEYKGDTPRSKKKSKGLLGHVVDGVKTVLDWLF